jgi:HSP20 family protein
MNTSLMQSERTQSEPTRAPEAQERPRPIVPAVDIYETDASVVMLADVPGVAQDGVEITVDRGTLTLRAHNGQSAPQGFQPVYQEYVPADFERQFTLSDSIDTERIFASTKDGVLRVELPKARQAVPRKITVTRG